MDEQIAGFKEYQVHPPVMKQQCSLAQPYCYSFVTTGLWIEVGVQLQRELEDLVTGRGAELTLRSALHSVKHLLIALLPAIALCDRRDLGGVYVEPDGQGSFARMYVYDAFPGGIGLAERGYAHINKLLRLAYDAVTTCDCDEGCPSCIQSGWCLEENNYLDKAAAVYLLGRLIGLPTQLQQRQGPLSMPLPWFFWL